MKAIQRDGGRTVIEPVRRRNAVALLGESKHPAEEFPEIDAQTMPERHGHADQI
jgi:virulence-associated protein VagC